MEPPHAPLHHYYGDESNRHSWVRALFDRSAVDYQRVHAAMALGTGSWYRRRALVASGLRHGMRLGIFSAYRASNPPAGSPHAQAAR